MKNLYTREDIMIWYKHVKTHTVEEAFDYLDKKKKDPDTGKNQLLESYEQLLLIAQTFIGCIRTGKVKFFVPSGNIVTMYIRSVNKAKQLIK